MAWIRAFGSYLPEHVATNAELASLTGADSEWIVKVSGIEERRFARDGEQVEDLAAAAARNCLEAAGMAASDLGLLIVSCSSAERRFPGPASAVAHRLGLSVTPAIDLPVASAGSLFGMALASQLTAAHGHVLVVGAEIMSRVLLRPPVNRDIAVLFGDGAGACLISPDGGFARILDSVLYSDGSLSEILHLDLHDALRMDGRAVILQAARKIPRAIDAALSRSSLAPQQVQAFVLHQANLNLILKVAQTLGVGEEKFPSSVRRYGNTSSASMLIAAAEWWTSAQIEPGAPVVFSAFGAGVHWGALAALPC